MSSAISEVTGTHKWPKHCGFPLTEPNHSLQPLGATGSSTVPRNRHGPLCVTGDLVPGTVLLHWLCSLWMRHKALSSEEVTLLVFQGHMLFSEWYYLAILPLSYKEIIWYKLTSPTFPAELTEVSHLSKASWSLTASLQRTEVIKLKKWKWQEAKKYSDLNLRRCEIPPEKAHSSLLCCFCSKAKQLSQNAQPNSFKQETTV